MHATYCSWKNLPTSFDLVTFHMDVPIQPRISSLACVPLYKIQSLPQRNYMVLQWKRNWAKPTALCDVLINWAETHHFWTINYENINKHSSYILWTSYSKGMTQLLTVGDSLKRPVKINKKMKCGEQLCKVVCVCLTGVCEKIRKSFKGASHKSRGS